MTISTEPSPLSYNGDDSTVAFPITWNYFAKSHVVATLRSAAGVETTWVLDTDYTLTAVNLGSGTLTATTAPATGDTLVISLDPPNTQETSLPIGGPLPSPSIEDALDLAAQRSGKLESLFDRTVRVPKTDTASGGGMEIPIDTVRASKFLAFDASGNLIASVGTSDNLGPVTAFANTLLDDADADAVIETLSDGATAEASPAVGDFALISDITANDGRKATLQNIFNLLLSLANTFTATQTISGAALELAEGAAVASAATTDIWAPSDGNTVHVTGTTTITSLGTAPQAGAYRRVIFDGALTLTHGANLNLPGAANITTAADDTCLVYADTTTQLDVVQYQKANGQSIIRDFVELGVQATTSGSSKTFTGIPAGAKEILVVFNQVSSDTATNFFLISIGPVGGVETSGYTSTSNRLDQAGGSAGTNRTDSFVVFVNTAAEQFSGHMVISNVSGSSWIASHKGMTSTTNVIVGGGVKTITGTVERLALNLITGLLDAGSVNVFYRLAS